DDSIRATNKLAGAFTVKKARANAPWLLKILAARSTLPGSKPEDYPVGDYLSALASERLAQIHDPALLVQALRLRPGAAEILNYGFGTPKGRDFLLARVSDEKEPLASRIRYAKALVTAGAVYRSTLIRSDGNWWHPVGEPDTANSGYLTRIARAARVN